MATASTNLIAVPTAMQRSSASAITTKLTESRLSAGQIARLIDQANDDLRRPAEAKEIVRERGLRWAERLEAMGVATNADVVAAFDLALASKQDTYALTWSEVQTAARKVLARAGAAPVLAPLADCECEQYLALLPDWASEQTPTARAWLREQRRAFEQYARSPKELEVLRALQALDVEDAA